MTARTRSWSFALCLCAVSASAASAQQFVDSRLSARVPWIRFDSAEVVVGDVDGDGDADAILAGGPASQLWLNDGFGNFAPAPFPTDVVPDMARLGDVDADGDLDCVAIGSGNRLLLNDGTGTFTDAVGAIPPTPSSVIMNGLELADIDGDNDLDIITGSLLSPYVLRNDGGTFTDVTLAVLPPTGDLNHVQAADLDGDGDIDILGSPGGPSTPLLLFNDGTGVFTDVTATNLPPGVNGRRILLADFDGDGDCDAVTASDSPATLLLNDGAGQFSVSPGIPASRTFEFFFAVGDLDGDGDTDIITETDSDDFHGVLLNDGVGNFTDVSASAFSSPPGPNDFALIDADGDGADDLLLYPVAGFAELFANDGSARFDNVTPTRAPDLRDGGSVSLFVDYDLDGDPDIVRNMLNEPPRFVTNDGHGVFVDETAARRPVVANETAKDLAVIDLRSDGDPDLLSSRYRLWVNDGTGHYTDASASLPASTFEAALDLVMIADLDGDGDDDAILYDIASPIRQIVLIQDANGQLIDETASRFPSVSYPIRQIQSADVDNDGDQDLLCASNAFITPILRVFINDGTGVFTDEGDTRMPATVTSSWGYAPIDVDNDGDTDVLLSPSSGTAAGNALINDGSGVFSLVTGVWPGPSDRVWRFAFADVDEDGDLDFATAREGFSSGPDLFVNEGNGTFTYSTRIETDTSGSAFVVDFADIDRDGDVDLLYSTTQFGGNRLYVNRHRQLDSVYDARLGTPLPLRFHATPGYGTVDVTGYVLLNFVDAVVDLPTPFGLFMLESLGHVLVGSVSIPAATGTADLTLIVPNDPGLIGFDLFFQGVIADPASPVLDIRLTGRVTDKVE